LLSNCQLLKYAELYELVKLLDINCCVEESRTISANIIYPETVTFIDQQFYALSADRTVRTTFMAVRVSHDSAVGIATGYGLHDQGVGI
jgi:hypothetical protein